MLLMPHQEPVSTLAQVLRMIINRACPEEATGLGGNSLKIEEAHLGDVTESALGRVV